MKITTRTCAFILFAAALGYNAFPSSSEKAQLGLRLNAPVESPNGVTFVWTGGAADTPHSIYRRVKGESDWTRIAMNLGPSGMTTVPGFTLDRDFEYRIQAEQP